MLRFGLLVRQKLHFKDLTLDFFMSLFSLFWVFALIWPTYMYLYMLNTELTKEYFYNIVLLYF